MAGGVVILGAIFWHGVDVVPFLIAGTWFMASGGAFAILYALLRVLGFVR